jgi:hypothetical protein
VSVSQGLVFETVDFELIITWKTTVVRSGPTRFVCDGKQRKAAVFAFRQDGPLLLASDGRKLTKEVMGVGSR